MHCIPSTSKVWVWGLRSVNDECSSAGVSKWTPYTRCTYMRTGSRHQLDSRRRLEVRRHPRHQLHLLHTGVVPATYRWTSHLQVYQPPSWRTTELWNNLRSCEMLVQFSLKVCRMPPTVGANKSCHWCGGLKLADRYYLILKVCRMLHTVDVNNCCQ